MTSTTVKTSAAADKKDVQKLQRAIIDGLEAVSYTHLTLPTKRIV